MVDFVKQCGPDVDFLSFHRYGSGNGAESTDRLMDSATAYGASLAAYRSLVAQASGARAIPIMLDEYGVNYNWRSGEARQWSNVGAVFYASVLRNIAYAGITYALNWDLKDRVYGLTDMRDSPRPIATVLTWGCHYLTGDLCLATSSHPRIEAMAVRQSDGCRSILLLNKAAGTATISLNLVQQEIYSGSLQLNTLDQAGTSTTTAAPSMLENPIIMPPYSLMLVRG